MTVLKKIDVLNDNVAVLRDIEMPDGIMADQAALEKISNEGIIVGVGPDAGIVQPGDRVIFYPKKYLEMRPASGGYEGKSVLVVRKADLVVRIGKTDKYEFVDKV